jgi:hypothetical protein
MSGIFDDLVGAVGAVAAAAPPTPVQMQSQEPLGSPTGGVIVATSVEARLTALEAFAATWGPIAEKLGPLLEKLEGL